MKTIILSCFSLLMLSSCLEILGEPVADPTPLPSGPLIRKMTGCSAMQITYTYPSDEKNSSSQTDTAPTPPPAPTFFPTSPIRQLTLIRTKPFWHVVRLDTYGNTVEQWYNGSDHFYTASGISDPLLKNPSAPAEAGGTVSIDQSAFPDFNRFDFPDMEWVTAHTYVGIETVAGHKCRVFKQQNLTAWIDIETQFPVQWQCGDEKRTFEMLPPPAQRLTLPPQIAVIAAGMKHDRNKWANLAASANKK